MKLERDRQESVSDKAFLLAFLTKVSQHNGSSLGDRLKIQKLTFLLCYMLFQRRYKALNYTFFTYRWGPFTKDLYEAEADFEQAHLLDRTGRDYALSETGLFWGNSLYESIASDPDNSEIVQQLNDVVQSFASQSTRYLVDHTHQMSVSPVGWQEEEQLDQLPYHLNLTGILDSEEATALLEIDRGWLDSFARMLETESTITEYENAR